MAEASFIRPEQFWRQVGVRAGETVVHLGCGAGFYLVPVAHLVGRAGQAIGIDLLPHMLAATEGRAAREHVADIVRTIRANLEDARGSTLHDRAADWVLVANILHQSDADKILREAARIVRPTGHVIVAEWDVVATPLGPPPGKRIAKDEVVKIAAAVGLSVAREFAPSPYHYGLLLSHAAL